MSHLQLVALVVKEYQPAIDFFVDVLHFDLVEDVPSLTNDGRPKRWVVVRPPDGETGILPGPATMEHGRDRCPGPGGLRQERTAAPGRCSMGDRWFLDVPPRLAVVGCLAAALILPVEAQPSDAAAQVEAREIAFAKSMADRDLEAFATFISPEAIFFNGNEPLRGRDAIVQAWAGFFEGDDAPFSWHPDVVEVLDSGNLALSSGPVRNGVGEQVGRFNSIWRKDADGVWRVIFDKGS